MDKSIPTEAEEQKALVEWLRLKRIFHFSPMNENNSHKQNRKYAMIAEQKAKSMGKVKGASDIVVFLPDEILFIELKRRKKVLRGGGLSISHTKVSKEQYDFMTKVNKYEYADATICYGWIEAKTLIENKLKRGNSD